VHWTVYDPLADIPPDLWPAIVLKKAHHVRDVITTRIDDAMEILQDLATHEAWRYIGMEREWFMGHTCGAPDLSRLRNGHAVMRGHVSRLEAVWQRATPEERAAFLESIRCPEQPPEPAA
jgi:hypothetical protein